MAFSIRRFLFGYDFFISYSRSDANSYALRLTEYLISNGYSCYIDKWGSEPGKKLPAKLKRNVSNASILIVLGSNASLHSTAIDEEVEIFIQTKRMLIPVDFGALNTAIWWTKIEGLALTNERVEALSGESEVCEELKQRIKESFKYNKQSKRIRNFLIGGICFTLFLIGISVLFSLNIKNLNKEQNNLKIQNQKIESEKLSEFKKNTELQAKNVAEKRKNDTLLKTSRELTQSITTKQEELNGLTLKIEKYKTGNTSLVKLLLQDFDLRIVSYPNDWPIPLKINKSNPFTIYLVQNKASLHWSAREALDSFIQAWTVDGNEPNIVIEGHYGGVYLDFEKEILVVEKSKMTAEYSIAVSARLAKSISDYLISKGIPRSKITSFSYGNTKPVDKVSLLNNRTIIYTK